MWQSVVPEEELEENITDYSSKKEERIPTQPVPERFWDAGWRSGALVKEF